MVSVKICKIFSESSNPSLAYKKPLWWNGKHTVLRIQILEVQVLSKGNNIGDCQSGLLSKFWKFVYFYRRFESYITRK